MRSNFREQNERPKGKGEGRDGASDSEEIWRPAPNQKKPRGKLIRSARMRHLGCAMAEGSSKG